MVSLHPVTLDKRFTTNVAMSCGFPNELRGFPVIRVVETRLRTHALWSVGVVVVSLTTVLALVRFATRLPLGQSSADATRLGELTH